MKHLYCTTVVAVTLAFSAASVSAQMKVDDAIKFRQAGYRFMAWNMGRVDASLKGEFKLEEVVKAANAIQAIANSGMGALYPAGSDKGTGFHPTHVKAAFFAPANAKKLGEIAGNFNREANEFAKAAAGGDKEAVKAQYDKLGKACKACHEDFRKEDH